MIFAAAALLATAPVSASAATPQKLLAVCSSTPLQNFFGFQPWYACLPRAADGSPRIEKLNDIFLIIFPLVDSLIKVAALVAVGVIFYMLIQMVTARGDAGKIKTSVEGIRDAVIGLIITLISVAIVNFIAGAFNTTP